MAVSGLADLWLSDSCFPLSDNSQRQMTGNGGKYSIVYKYIYIHTACLQVFVSLLFFFSEGTFEALFEARSEMTCFVHIFQILPPFVVQMSAVNTRTGG